MGLGPRGVIWRYNLDGSHVKDHGAETFEESILYIARHKLMFLIRSVYRSSGFNGLRVQVEVLVYD